MRSSMHRLLMPLITKQRRRSSTSKATTSTDFKNDMTVSASVTANHPINPKAGVFYFEITIDHFKGNSALSIGIASKSLRKNFQVGWDLNSWGFHSDDGFLYFGNGKQNITYSYEYREGDTVGCGVNFLDKAVFFTINGEMMGIAFRFVKESIPLYPAIGLSQAGTEINANFGDQTFLFNIVDYKKSIMAKPNHTQPIMTWNSGCKNEKVFQILPDGLSVIASGKDTGCIRGPKVSPRDKDVFYFEIAILYMPPSDLGYVFSSDHLFCCQSVFFHAGDIN
ncbi:MAG: concanavalin A-like lectin/glucanase domain-containing protein [Linnemannia gamsii]|nr:MAG: concanavalin A-like lectin/glucanase domain-containing protein [Linnemannia gamsii]